MSSRKILFVSPDASMTGAPVLLLRFLKWLQRNRELPFTVLCGREGPLISEFRRLARVDVFEPRPPLMYRAINRLSSRRLLPNYSSWQDSLRQRLLEDNIGLIYANTIVTGRILRFVSPLQCPVICHVHELDEVIRMAGEDNMEAVRKLTSRYIAVCEAVRRNLIKYGLDERKITVVNGFMSVQDSDVSKLQRSIIRKQMGWSDTETVVCGCGSIEPRKGTDLFIDVAAQVVSRCESPVRFVWIGGRPDQVRAMRRRVAAHGLSATVHFTGHKQDVLPYFAAGDVLLLPSREDAYPLVMLEAALLRNPTVCFGGTGGAPEFVGDDAGIVVPEISAERMADCLIHMIRSSQMRQTMGACARSRVLTGHDVEVAAPKLADIIESALAETGHPVTVGRGVL